MSLQEAPPERTRLHYLCRGHALLVSKQKCDECGRGNPPSSNHGNRSRDAAADPSPVSTVRLPTAKLSVQIAEEEDSMLQHFDVYITLRVPKGEEWQPVAHPLASYMASFDTPVSIEDAEPADVEEWIGKWRKVALAYGFSFEVAREVREWVRSEKSK